MSSDFVVPGGDGVLVRGLSRRDKTVFVGGVSEARGAISSHLP